MNIRLNLVVYVLGSLVLSSCAALTPTASVQMTAAPAAPATQESTATVAPTATEAPSPTPTENPLAGAPEGATGKDSATGEWTKTGEDGATYFYKDKNISEPGWYTEAIVNGTFNGVIPLINEKGQRTGMGMNVWREEGTPNFTLQHPDMSDMIIQGDSFSLSFIPKMLTRFISESGETQSKVGADWVAGKDFTFHATTPIGPIAYNTGSTINIYIKNKPLTNPEYTINNMQATMTSDAQNNLHVVEFAASSDISKAQQNDVSKIPSADISKMNLDDFETNYLRLPFVIFATNDMASSKTIENSLGSSNIFFTLTLLYNQNPPYLIFTP